MPTPPPYFPVSLLLLSPISCVIRRRMEEPLSRARCQGGGEGEGPPGGFRTTVTMCCFERPARLGATDDCEQRLLEPAD
jgi:hypothetical protein